MSDFHGRIMNIECADFHGDKMIALLEVTTAKDAYKYGHRDARHAAAEIANEADATIAAKAAEIARLREALEHALIALNEHGHIYPETVAKVSAALSQESGR